MRSSGTTGAAERRVTSRHAPSTSRKPRTVASRPNSRSTRNFDKDGIAEIAGEQSNAEAAAHASASRCRIERGSSNRKRTHDPRPLAIRRPSLDPGWRPKAVSHAQQPPPPTLCSPANSAIGFLGGVCCPELRSGSRAARRYTSAQAARGNVPATIAQSAASDRRPSSARASASALPGCRCHRGYRRSRRSSCASRGTGHVRPRARTRCRVACRPDRT